MCKPLSNKTFHSGSIKGNIGHIEGASGLAGILKSICRHTSPVPYPCCKVIKAYQCLPCSVILEKGMIPPNANFEKINPDVDVEFYNITVSTYTSVYLGP
jgi:hypothetical protein